MTHQPGVYVPLRALFLVFCKFATELQPLIHVRTWILLIILRMNGQNLTKFCIHIIIDKI